MSLKNLLIILAIGAVLFIPFLGHVHLFDWDEINFAESAREMLATHQYSQVQINFEPFYEKPPLFMWLQALSMSIFGVNEFAARFPNAIVGIITLLVIFNIGARLIDERFAWLWVFCYIGSFLPHFYFKTGLIDPLFNIFIFLGIYQFVKLTDLENYKPAKCFRLAMYAGIFIGLAILTKGPVAMLVTMFCLFIYWGTFGFKPVIPFKYIVVFMIAAFVVSCAWFGLDTVKNGPKFIFAFIDRQIALFRTPDAGHDGPFYYHFVVLLVGCFPASIFMFSALPNEVSEKHRTRNMKKWMTILLITVLLIFSIVRTKIIHYSSLAYFPITFLAGYGLFRQIYLSRNRPKPVMTAVIMIMATIIAFALAAMPYLARHTALIEPFITDKFGKAALHADVTWTGWESAVGIIYFVLFMAGMFLLTRKEVRAFGATALLLTGALTVQLALFVFSGKIESYSQRAAVDFFISKQHEDCYVDVWGYRSYAQIYYSMKKKTPQSDTLTLNKLVFNPHMDKPVYIVTKTGNDLEHYNHFVKIGEKNGFVFLKRVVY